ncbi:hypothetical protein [Nostoc sp.]
MSAVQFYFLHCVALLVVDHPNKKQSQQLLSFKGKYGSCQLLVINSGLV